MLNILYEKGMYGSEVRATEMAYNLTKAGVIAVTHAIESQSEMDEYNNSTVLTYVVPQTKFKLPKGGSVVGSAELTAGILAAKVVQYYKGGALLVVGNDHVMPLLIRALVSPTSAVNVVSNADENLGEYMKYANFVVLLEPVPKGTQLEIQDNCTVLDYSGVLPKCEQVIPRDEVDTKIISILIDSLPKDMQNILDMKEGEEYDR